MCCSVFCNRQTLFLMTAWPPWEQTGRPWLNRGRGRSRISINLEVKNRRGTAASKPMKKGVYLFGENPEKPFRPSREDEINVLAITGYHAGAISKAEEHRLVQNFLDQPPVAEVLDAVALYVVGHGSRERLFFPNNRALHRKDLILRSLLKPETIEDHSRIISHRFPVSWEDLGIKDLGTG
jgi:hypothetical protein